MPKGYVIFTEDIRESGMNVYFGGPSSIAQGGASVPVVDPSPSLEGQWHGDQTVILGPAQPASRLAVFVRTSIA